MTRGGRNVVALAIGDPNGIGPEIAVKAALACRERGGPDVVLVGDAHVIGFYAERLAPGASIVGLEEMARDRATIRMSPVDALPPDAFKPGEVAAAAGRATIAYVREAVRLVRAGAASAIVACPHSEAAVNAAGIVFSGYPRLMAELTDSGEDHVFLMLVGGGLRIVHATLHEAIDTALARLSPALVERAVRTADQALRDMGLAAPRIGVFGINPHAGEGGLFGDADDRITAPAVQALRAAGLDVEGPQGADTMLPSPGFDAFVAMYHDQGHIPIKLLAGRNSAAVSIGAGLIFSSVGHGSAFDIAGQGVASPEPILRAIDLVGGATTLPEIAA